MWANCSTDQGLISVRFAQEFISGPSEPGNTNNRQIDDHINTYIPQHLAALAPYTGRQGNGVELGCYEIGPHTVNPDQLLGGFPSSGINIQNGRDFYFECLESKYQVFVESYHLQNMLRLGVKRPSRFDLSGPFNYTQLWGLQRTNSLNLPATPQYKAVRQVNRGASA